MKLSRLLIALLSLLAASSVVMAGNGLSVGADPSDPQTIYGEVIAFTGGSGSGMPMVTVDDDVLGEVGVALGPIWFLQAAEFSAAPGDTVDILAYTCATCAADWVAATIENITTGDFVELRDATGRPLWTQRQSQRGGSGRVGQGNGSGGQNGGGQGGGDGTGEPGGSGNGTGSGPSNGSGLDMSLIETLTGAVVDFTGHAGSGQPVLTLDVGGVIYEITVSPYGPIEAAGLVIEPGLILTVVVAPTECVEDPHLVTISIQDDATGVQILLRDSETGFPITSGGGHNRPNWP